MVFVGFSPTRTVSQEIFVWNDHGDPRSPWAKKPIVKDHGYIWLKNHGRYWNIYLMGYIYPHLSFIKIKTYIYLSFTPPKKSPR